MSVNKLCPYCGTEKPDGPWCYSNATEEVVSLRARVKELEEKLKALEFVPNPMAVYGPVKLPPDVVYFTSGNTLPPKCAQCGRVL